MSELLTEPAAPAVSPTAATHRLDNALVWLMALACGLVVANIYYNQPLLAAIGRTFHISDSRASLLATATQVGYTLSMLLVVPLGDMLERKRLLLLLLLGVAACLGLAAWAPTFAVLAGASVLVGLCSAVPQLLLPMAAHLAPEADRGRIVGRIMSGLLIGILASRTLSGYVGAHLGWRAMFAMAAGLMLALLGLLAWRLPRDQPQFAGSYGALMKSLGTLVRTLPALRRSALVGGLLFAAFSVFWTTLAFFLEGPHYRYGSDVAGFFGLIGAVGALAAPLAGKAADTRGPDFAIGVGTLLALAAYAVLGLGGYHLVRLGAGRRSARRGRAGGPHLQPNQGILAGARGPQPPQHGVHDRLLHRRLAGLGGRRLRLDALRLARRVRAGGRLRGGGLAGEPLLRPLSRRPLLRFFAPRPHDAGGRVFRRPPACCKPDSNHCCAGIPANDKRAGGPKAARPHRATRCGK